MSYENATILFRHGRDDFAVWAVELPEQVLRQAKHSLNNATGDLGFVLDQLPAQEGGWEGPRSNFLFKDGSTLALFSMEMAKGFFDEYRKNYGKNSYGAVTAPGEITSTPLPWEWYNEKRAK